MEYKELKLTLKEDVSSELAEDILASELAELGFESFSSESRSFSAFIPHASIIDEVRIAEIISPWAEKTEWIFHAAQNWNRIWRSLCDLRANTTIFSAKLAVYLYQRFTHCRLRYCSKNSSVLCKAQLNGRFYSILLRGIG